MNRVIFAESVIDELRAALNRLDLQRIVIAGFGVISDGEAVSAEVEYSNIEELDDVPCRQMWIRQGESEQAIGILSVYTMVFDDDLTVLFAKEGRLIGIKERNRIRAVYRSELSRREP